LQAKEDRKLARNLKAEAWRAANERRRLALEEKKMANDEHQRLVEEERKLLFIDISNMDKR
jgi:hypothetical protein